MSLDDFITSSLEPGGVPADAAPDGEARALAPELDRQRALLGSPDTWAEPPPGLEDAVVAAILGEATMADDPASTPAPAAAAVGGVVGGDDGPAARRARSRWLRALPAAAVAAVLAVALIVNVGGGDGGTDAVSVELAGTELAPEAAGTVELHDTPVGVRAELAADGLPPSGPDEYYEAWVVAGEDRLMAIGTFHSRGDGTQVVLWSGVDLDDVTVIAITVEPDDGDVTTSGRQVLVGEMVTGEG